MERRLDKLLPPEESSRQTDDHESLLDFFVRVSPTLRRPNHFRVYAGKIESAVGSELRTVLAAPPQHGKTLLTLHGLAYLVRNHPGKRHAYITYSQQRARSVSKSVRRILSASGVVVSGTVDQMVLPNGGQILFTSIDGGITGEPVDGVAIIDDPFKNRREADSATRREAVEMAYREAIETRVHPGGSIMVLATRWHPKDLSGILVDEGWEYINLPAIAEANDPNGRAVGEALFPEERPIEFLERQRQRLLDFSFQALYQGHPRPKGGKVFHEPSYYSELPKRGYRGAYGIDLAYTAKTSADWSICVELWREDRPQLEPLYYVVGVDREQVEAPEFGAVVKRRVAARRWPALWRASGTEKGAASFLVKDGIPLRVEQPPGDKLVCAQAVAAAWNDGRVLVPDPSAFPDAARWLSAFIDTVLNFTGLGKEVDDDVDALGNAHKAMSSAQYESTKAKFSDRWS
jgi:hypothetical protein